MSPLIYVLIAVVVIIVAIVVLIQRNYRKVAATRPGLFLVHRHVWQ